MIGSQTYVFIAESNDDGRVRRSVLASLTVVAALGLIASTARSCRARHGRRAAKHEERRVDPLHRRRPGVEILAARSDQREQFQSARGRMAVQDRQPGHAPRVQARRHTADGEGRHLRDRRHAPLRRRARREDRRADVGARRARRRARRSCAAPVVGPRPLLLDRWQGRRARSLRDDRLSARRAEREDRRTASARSARTASST